MPVLLFIDDGVSLCMVCISVFIFFIGYTMILEGQKGKKAN